MLEAQVHPCVCLSVVRIVCNDCASNTTFITMRWCSKVIMGFSYEYSYQGHEYIIRTEIKKMALLRDSHTGRPGQAQPRNNHPPPPPPFLPSRINLSRKWHHKLFETLLINSGNWLLSGKYLIAYLLRENTIEGTCVLHKQKGTSLYCTRTTTSKTALANSNARICSYGDKQPAAHMGAQGLCVYQY